MLKEYGYDNILVIIDRFTKQIISILYIKKYNEKEFVELFVYYIYCYYSFSELILSDQRTQFVNKFWDELSAILKITLVCLSTDYLQIDG